MINVKAVTYTPSGVRLVFSTHVEWVVGPAIPSGSGEPYGVAKYPFVPGFHLVERRMGYQPNHHYILSSHKTLAEAMGILRILRGSQTFNLKTS
jgi:hypothetical protein